MLKEADRDAVACVDLEMLPAELNNDRALRRAVSTSAPGRRKRAPFA